MHSDLMCRRYCFVQVNVHSHEAAVSTTQDMRTEVRSNPPSPARGGPGLLCSAGPPCHAMPCLCHPPSRIRTVSVQVRKGDRIFVGNNILDVSVGEREISPSHIPVLQEFDGLSQNGASC